MDPHPLLFVMPLGFCALPYPAARRPSGQGLQRSSHLADLCRRHFLLADFPWPGVGRPGDCELRGPAATFRKEGSIGSTEPKYLGRLCWSLSFVKCEAECKHLSTKQIVDSTGAVGVALAASWTCSSMRATRFTVRVGGLRNASTHASLE